MVLLRIRQKLSLGKHERSGCSVSVVGIQKETRSPRGGLSFVMRMKLQLLAAVRQDLQTEPKQNTLHGRGMFAE